MQRKSRVVIVGAGLAGCFLAIILAKKGFQVDVHERASEKEMTNNASKRTFNLTIYQYGAQVLKKVGLWQDVQKIATPLKGVFIQLAYQTQAKFYLFPKKDQFTMSRAKLLEIFIKHTKKHSNITLHFHQELRSIDSKKRTLQLYDSASKKNTTVHADIVFGTDGVNSAVRAHIPQNTKQVQEYAPWIYKQIQLTAKDVQSMQLPKESTLMWLRKKALFIAFPTRLGGYNALLALPNNKNEGYPTLTSEKKIVTFLAQHFRSHMQVKETIIQAIQNNPEGRFSAIHLDTWFLDDFLVLAGDSAHGMYPFYGQGVSAAIADALVLSDLIDTYGEDWEKVLPEYQKLRKIQTDTQSNLSKDNLEDYQRDKKGDYKAIAIALDEKLYSLFPKIFLPSLFSMVAKDPMHAAESLAKYKRQRYILNCLGFFIAVWILVGVFRIIEKLQK